MKRKMEYQSLAAVHKTQDSGLQGVKILNPGKYESVSLVTCNSAADYANLYAREMLEFDSIFTNATVKETENTLNRKMCQEKFIDRTEMNCTESRLHAEEDEVARCFKMRNQLSADLAAVGNTNVAIRAKSLHGSGSIYQNKSGKISDPGRYEPVCLGTCNSTADFANVYAREMLEFDSLFRNGTVDETENTLNRNRNTCKAKLIDRTEMNCTESKLRVKEDVIAHSFKMRNQLSVDLAVGNTDVAIRARRLHGSGSIYQNKSGIQGVKILDPGQYEPVCLGTCNSPEGLSNLYAREMLEFDSVLKNATIEDTGKNRKTCEAKFIDQNCTESKLRVKEDVIAQSSKMRNQLSVDLAVAVDNTEIAIRAKRLRGSGSIYRNKSGMWRAQISYRNSNVHVGNYRTYEEAEAATHKKRHQLHSLNGELMCNDQNPEKQVSMIRPFREEHLAEVVSNADVGIRVKRLPGSGSISKTKEGRWQARIYSGKSRVRVGIYSTYEEAEVAIQKKRSVARVEMDAEEYRTTTTTRRSKESVVLIESINGREFSLLKNAEKKCKQMVDAAEESITNCAPATIECGDCKDTQVPEEPVNGELMCNQELNSSVINAYGELVGEFSRLDDDLWLVDSLDDAVQY